MDSLVTHTWHKVHICPLTLGLQKHWPVTVSHLPSSTEPGTKHPQSNNNCRSSVFGKENLNGIQIAKSGYIGSQIRKIQNILWNKCHSVFQTPQVYIGIDRKLDRIYPSANLFCCTDKLGNRFQCRRTLPTVRWTIHKTSLRNFIENILVPGIVHNVSLDNVLYTDIRH